MNLRSFLLRILRRACYRSWYMGRMMYFLLCNGMRLCQTMPGYTLLFLLLEGIQRCSLGSGAMGRAGRRMWIYSGRKCILLLQYWRIQPHMRSLPLKLRNWCLFIPLQAMFYFRLAVDEKMALKLLILCSFPVRNIFACYRVAISPKSPWLVGMLPSSGCALRRDK